MLARRWARATRRSLAAVAAQWELPWLTAKSTKGGLDADWRSADGRADAMDRLANDVINVAGLIKRDLGQARGGLQKSILRLARRLVRVVSCDLNTDEQGRLTVAQYVAEGRLVSLTDPEARSGRKSKSQTFKGFQAPSRR